MFSAEITSRAKNVIDECTRRGIRLALAESCTGGLISAALINIPGASNVVDRGLVTYANEAKMDLLGVQADVLDQHGAVSEETALAMAEGALNTPNVQAAVAVTGIAGPAGGTPEKPVGRVHIAAAREGYSVRHQKCDFGDIGRDAIRFDTVSAALDMLYDLVCAGAGET